MLFRSAERDLLEIHDEREREEEVEERAVGPFLVDLDDVAVLGLFALVAATATSAAAAPKPVSKVDSVSARVVDNHLVITASGAVATGGWTNPRLHMTNFHKPEGDTEIVQFLATPPVSEAVVIQALVPISTTATFPLPPYAVTQVKVVAETNSVMAPIAVPTVAAPASAAPPPAPGR